MGEIVITFPRPIRPLSLPLNGTKSVSDEILTCEAAIVKCLKHFLDESQITYQSRQDSGISTYVQAFGLRIVSRETKTYIPLHYEFEPGKNHHMNYHFCVRHIPLPPKETPNAQLLFKFNIVWEILILQVVEDFLMKELSNEDIGSHIPRHLLIQLATFAVIILNSPHNNNKKIGENFALSWRKFNIFNYHNNFSKDFFRRLSKSCVFNRLYDQAHYYIQFKKQISESKRENKNLGTIKRDFIHNVLYRHPDYHMELFEAKTELADGKLLDGYVQIRKLEHGKIHQFNLYFNKDHNCCLTKIQQVIMKKPGVNDYGHDNKLVIETKCWKQSFSLIFKDAETMESFVSMLQGVMSLSIQPDLVLNHSFMPPSSKIKAELRSFWPLSHDEARHILWLSNEKKPDAERHDYLLYQERNKLYTFVVATSQEGAFRHCVEWTAEKKFVVYKEDQQFTYSRAIDVLKKFNDQFGVQLNPRKFSKKQTVDESSIYHIVLPANDGNDENDINVYDFNPLDKSNTRTFILDKDVIQGSRREIANENDDLKRFKVVVRGEDCLLVELESKHPKANDAINKNISTMTKLAECSKDSVLKFYQIAFIDQKISFAYEYPTHGMLSAFLNANKKKKLPVNCKLRLCLQVIGTLEVIEQSNVMHGDIRSSNFYVFIYDEIDKPVVKLGDPGMVYMYDDPQYEFHYRNKRSPWLAPERLINLEHIKIETECYAVGTTLCEVLHETDNFKQLLGVDSDKALKEFFDERKVIPPPDLSFSDDNPNILTPEARDIIKGAWKAVEQCWNFEPSERPTAQSLANTFRELLHSCSDLPFERLMDVCIPMLEKNSIEGRTDLTPRDLNALMKKQKKHFIELNQVTQTDCQLGNGHFGEVKKCFLKKKKMTSEEVEEEELSVVAVKTLLNNSREKIADMVKEIDVIAGLHHENIVKFLHFTVSYDKMSIMLLMEYLEEGSLLKFVKGIPRNLGKPEQKRHYFKTLLMLSHDVAKGMEYLHSQKIIHCDLAARNVLLLKDTNGPVTNFVAKVSDFGLAKILRVDQDYYCNKESKSIKLPQSWIPPQYIRGEELNGENRLVLRFEGDVWSYGVMLWEVFSLGLCPSKELLQKERNIISQLQAGCRLRKNAILYFNDEMNERVYTDLMMKCWEYEHKDRPSFTLLKENIRILLSSL